ncbi:MAG: methionine--tRNA ligase, partial [archaeon]|nr:methionine--tRNA ligase [archaeon]
MVNSNKKRKWVVTSAWPYVNATPHLGNMIGSVLSSDVFARYLRLKGDEVVFVSGSDAHGTPIAVAAIKEGMESEELATIKHKEIIKIFEDWNISYDNYTTTHNPTHIKFVQEFYKKVQENGFVKIKENEAYYCPECDFFLPDRFIEGTCPHCNTPGARGDQCDFSSCGKVLEPEQLIDPYCNICKIRKREKLTTPIKKTTKHWYMDFPKIQKQIRKFIDDNKIIPPNSRSMCLNSIDKGLPERSITRDLKWGIPAGPAFEGADEKTIYVWFEAVLGYISAVKEWAEKIQNKPELFEYFWNDPETKSVYFIGKDNIIFHLMVFPGLILAYNEDQEEKNKFPMPFNVSSTEFLNYENDKFSKSRGVGIWTDEALELASVDYWRYSLIRNRPEGRDVSFIWAEFERNINEMNDKIGNFVHRAFTFIYKKFDGKVPPIVKLDEDDKYIIELIKKAPEEVGNLIENFHLKDALGKIVSIASEGNVYLNKKAPWKLMKENKPMAGQIFNICAQLSRTLAILLSPFCPESSDKILSNIGCKECVDELIWDSAGELAIDEGQEVKLPKPIFQKIDLKELFDQLIEIRKKKGETFKIPESVAGSILKKKDGKKNNAKKSKDKKIQYKFFQKFNLRTAKVKSIEKINEN